MKEKLFEITLKQNLNIYNQQDFEEIISSQKSNETFSQYDQNSYTADYNYKNKKFYAKGITFPKRLLFIFLCFILTWCALLPKISDVYQIFTNDTVNLSSENYIYTPLEKENPLFDKEYTTVGSPIEVYWTVTETGIVANLTPFKTAQGDICPAQDAGLQIDDEIIKINGYPLIQKDKWSQITSSNPIPVTIIRNDDIMEIKVTPALAIETNSYKIGIEYIINKAYSQTASTLTLVDKQTGKFASTAHIVEFSKEDSEKLQIPELQKLNEGVVFNAKVTGTKSDGLETESISRIGSVSLNNDFGVFGYIDNSYINNLPSYKVAPVSEIQTGDAYILSSVEGEIKQYPISIVGVDLTNKSAIEFVVNDEYLKSIGYLLHGMSGSPIIQNNKVIGAVARMNTKTMQCYGTLAEIMMTNLENIE